MDYSSYFGESDYNETIEKILYNGGTSYLIGTVISENNASTYKQQNIRGKEDIFITLLNSDFEEQKTVTFGSVDKESLLESKIVNNKLILLGTTQATSFDDISIASSKASFVKIFDLDLLEEASYILDEGDYSELHDITFLNDNYYIAGVVSKTVVDDINHVGGHSDGVVVKIPSSLASGKLSSTSLFSYVAQGEQRFTQIVADDPNLYIFGDGEVDSTRYNSSQTLMMLQSSVTNLENNFSGQSLCYLGGKLNEQINSLTLKEDIFFLAGYTLSTDFADHTISDVSRNAFVAQIPKSSLSCTNATLDLSTIKTKIYASDDNKSDTFTDVVVLDNSVLAYGSIIGDYSSSENSSLTPLGDLLLVGFDINNDLNRTSLGIFGGSQVDHPASMAKVSENTVLIASNTFSSDMLMVRPNQERADNGFISALKPLDADINVEFKSVLPDPLTLGNYLTVRARISNKFDTNDSIPSTLYNLSFTISYKGGFYKEHEIILGDTMECRSEVHDEMECTISKLEFGNPCEVEIKLEPKRQGTFTLEARGVSESFTAEENTQNNFTTYDVEVINVTASGSPKEGQCFIATAAFGSHLEPHVKFLRYFRDNYLTTNAFGKELVRFYYKNSPPIAAWIVQNEWAKPFVQVLLTPFILLAKIIDIFGYEFILILLLIGVSKQFVFLQKRVMCEKNI
jgi:hypothetical protein